MVRALIGDLFESDMQTLVNTVNCVGVMGKGIALEFRKRYPDMFKDYVVRCEMKKVKPGVPYLYTDLTGISIINFPTKDHWRSPAKLEYIINGLKIFLDQYNSWNIRSVAFPPLGCGNGELEWFEVGPILYQNLIQLDIQVEIYAPYGTKKQYLSQEFLNQSQITLKSQTYSGYTKLALEWIPLLEVLYRLEQQPYVQPVGRTIFQKICYIMTIQGIETGFHFRHGYYGPYAPEIHKAISVFANSNLIREQQLGRMTAIKVGAEYNNIREKYLVQLNAIEPIISKTVDLFCRIKTTEQAEEVASVLYAVLKIKEKSNYSSISEQDVFDYILKWKKYWDNVNKRKAVASAIRNLTAFDWFKLRFSDSLSAEMTEYEHL